LFLSPAAILLFVFGILPVGYAFYISLHRWRIQKGDFIGLANYTRLLGPGSSVAMLLVGIGLLIGAYYVWQAIPFQAGAGGLDCASLWRRCSSSAGSRWCWGRMG